MKTATEINLKLAEQYEQIAIYHRQLAHLEKPATDEVAAKPPHEESAEEQPVIQPRYKIAKAYIGKFALLIKAMYDVGMFIKADGSRATNVEDLARYIGHALGEDFPNWQQTLRGATLPTGALDFYDQLCHWSEKYKNKIKKDDC